MKMLLVSARRFRRRDRSFRTFLALVGLLVLVPALQSRAEALNVDAGLTHGVPDSSFGGAADQPGPWNPLGLAGIASAIDASAAVTDVTISVSAASDGGDVGLSPSNDVELLLFDNLFASSSEGASWSIVVEGLDAGLYEVFLYEPANTVVPTGLMSVNGVDAGSLEGQPSFPATPLALTRGQTFTSVVASVDQGGILEIEGVSDGPSPGLAGFQLVSLPEPSMAAGGLVAVATVAALARRRRARS